MKRILGRAGVGVWLALAVAGCSSDGGGAGSVELGGADAGVGAGGDADAGGADGGGPGDVGGTPGVGDVAGGLTTRTIAASATGPGIDDVLGEHHIVTGSREGRVGRLLLFFPGTTATPQMYASILETGAQLGYHAIGLAYENELAVNRLCAGQGLTDCHERMRREVLLGVDENDKVVVTPANAAYHRLGRLLDALEAREPDEGWQQFRDAGEVRWGLVTVAGHSQGAGHAAFTGRLYGVARVVMFSGTEPVAWTSARDFATPSDRFFGFAHELEPIFAPIVRSWDNIGIPGTVASVDGAAAPFGGTHRLSTAVDGPCTGDPASEGYHHNCHCVDGWMPEPTDGTAPYYRNAWQYLFAP